MVKVSNLVVSLEAELGLCCCERRVFGEMAACGGAGEVEEEEDDAMFLE